MISLLDDLRQGCRVFIKSPGFTLAVLATLGLGIGANTALFTVINTVLLHPLPYPESGRIVNITRRGGGPDSVPMFTYWQQNNSLFEDLAAYDFMGSGLNLSGGDRPELVQGLTSRAIISGCSGRSLSSGARSARRRTGGVGRKSCS